MDGNQSQTDLPNGVIKTVIMNHIGGRDEIANPMYLDVYLRSLGEAARLLKEARLLFDNSSYQRSYFLGFSALEEISKSQLAADVYTGLIDESIFKNAHRDHKEKIAKVKWIQVDGNTYPIFAYDGTRIEDFNFQKKLKSMYVDIDFSRQEASSPGDIVSKKDAENIIKAVMVGLCRIYQVTEEDGEQIGTKGFLK